MKTIRCLAAILLAWGAVFAGTGKLPVSEDDIVREVEALIDATPAPTPRQAEEVRKLIDRGVRAHDAKRFDDALDLYRKALAIDPVSADAHYEIAYTLSESGDQAEALASAIRSLTIDPKDEETYVLKANILDNLGFPEEAKKTYLGLLEIKPESYSGHLNLGICEIRLGNNAAAETEFKKARDIDPAKASPYLLLSKLANFDDCNYAEQDYLTKFLEVGKNDPRAGAARARLKELQSSNITMDVGDPYMSVSLVENMARTAWRTTKHRELHPDACGYRLTFEEDKDVLSGLVLPAWRKLKADDPKANHDRYDLLLKIDEAGFLDEYIYATKTSAIGPTATAWLVEHADRKQAFEAWARKEGLLDEDPESADDRGIPADIMKSMEVSKVHYLVESEGTGDGERFLAAERARFRAAVKPRGDDEADCRAAESTSATLLGTTGARALVPVFRCRQPEDEAFLKATKPISLLGLVVRDMAPKIEGSTFVEKDEVKVNIASPAWLGYLMAKAAWRNEPELRKQYGGEPVYAPTVEEEIFAFRAADAAYRNGREQANSENTTFEPVESLERLGEVVKAGRLRGYVLYEVIHRRYGISLKSLTPADAKAVHNYLMADVMVSAAGLR